LHEGAGVAAITGVVVVMNTDNVHLEGVAASFAVTGLGIRALDRGACFLSVIPGALKGVIKAIEVAIEFACPSGCTRS
jgi:hypothetical protein